MPNGCVQFACSLVEVRKHKYAYIYICIYPTVKDYS